MKRRVLGLAMALVLAPGAALAYCPCYTASSSYNSYKCGVEAADGTNPSPAEWGPIFALVAQGPSAWGSAGPSVGDIGQGCGKPEATHSVPARFPCEILHAIAMQESGWRQFCVPDKPADEVGGASRTIISFDCGYGVGQVTSGMHVGESPSFDRSRVASDPTYNLATGTQILAGKWKATSCVGDNQPSIVEDWYTAVWAYNGLAYSNNPNNPNLDPNRGVYDPKVGGAYTYQERVFGWVENPPGSDYWDSVALAYPDRADCGTTGSPPDMPDPHCASPTDCGNARSVHASACFAEGAAGAGGSTASGGAAGATGSAGAGASGGQSAQGGTSSGGQSAQGGAPSGGHSGQGATTASGGAVASAGTSGHVSIGGAAGGGPNGGAPPTQVIVNGANGDGEGGCGCEAPGRRGERPIASLVALAIAVVFARSRRRAKAK